MQMGIFLFFFLQSKFKESFVNVINIEQSYSAYNPMSIF